MMVRGVRGRPRKDGVRHASGQLVQKVEPNPKVVQLRRALVGESAADPAATRLAAAEDPMTLALARGWITEAQHQAGLSYAAAWRRSHPQRRAPGLTEVADPDRRDLRAVGEMSDVEIEQAFERLLCASERAGAPSEESQVEARTRYNTMSRALTSAEQNEVFLCFCLASWPQWVLQRCDGRFDTSWERKRRLLTSGLETLAAIRERRR